MRQIAGTFAQLEKTRLVGKLRAARDRKRARGAKLRGANPTDTLNSWDFAVGQARAGRVTTSSVASSIRPGDPCFGLRVGVALTTSVVSYTQLEAAFLKISAAHPPTNQMLAA